MHHFLWIIIGLTVCLAVSFIPVIKKLFSASYDSKQFKAIRFVITVFGVASLILGFIKWYTAEHQMEIHERANFEIFSISIEKGKQKSPVIPECALIRALDDIFHRSFHGYFMRGWRPVVTRVGKKHDQAIVSFAEDKGEFIPWDKIEDVINDFTETCGPAPNIGFYIPPNATFNISFKREDGRLWSLINIENDVISLNLKVTTLGAFCHAEMTYKKKGIFNFIFYDYALYDQWFTLLKTGVLELQEVNRVRACCARPNAELSYRSLPRICSDVR